MVLSWLRSRPAQTRRRATFRPMLETLGERINPTSPHFISATSSVDGSGALVVKFKEAGLGDNQLINYELTGNVNATFQFQNNGGNIVQGTPFFAVDVTLATGQFKSVKNGNITATLTSEAPSPNPADLKTINGNGWKQILTVSYTNLVLTDTTNNLTINPPNASATIITPVPK